MALLPHFYFEKIEDITPERLERLGIKGTVLDIDNTLTFDFCPDVSESVLGWLDALRDSGIKAVIVSNNSEQRAKPFAEKCGLQFIAHAKKPGGESLARVKEILGCGTENIGVIGDQLFTDMAYARNNGMTALMVKPLGGEKLAFVKFKRVLEKPFMPFIRRKRYKDER